MLYHQPDSFTYVCQCAGSNERARWTWSAPLEVLGNKPLSRFPTWHPPGITPEMVRCSYITKLDAKYLWVNRSKFFAMLSPRHGSSDNTAGGTVEHHWGYFTRELPCTKDPGNCAYLDAVYGNHDLSMIYSAILWAVILGILVLAGLVHYLLPVSRHNVGSKMSTVKEKPNTRQSTLYRIRRSVDAILNRYLLPESFTSLFGPTTRLNILVLTILVGYLSIFTFVGITYQTWYSPVEGANPRTTRVGLGPWADRIGVMAFALTPLSLLLSSRESLLSLITGIPYHHFNFLHRWLGYIIYIQSALHTIAWTIVEGRLYQPQPDKWNSFIGQQYIISGIVAMICITFLVVHSTKWGIELTGYEFFRKTHYAIAMVYIGTCWGHWSKLRCWMIASLILWMLDRTIRLIRQFTIHCASQPLPAYSFCGLHVPNAKATSFRNDLDGDVVRLHFRHDYPSWKIGQHFYLCFPELSIWQAHPMTPSSLPMRDLQGQTQSHTYIIRAKKGLTRDLARMARGKDTSDETGAKNGAKDLSVVLSGPYGQSIVDDDLVRTDDINLLCIAGGTGVTFILPFMMSLVQNSQFHCRKGLIEFIWVIRRRTDMQWIAREFDTLCTVAQTCQDFRICVFVTREDLSAETDSSPSSQSIDVEPSDKAVHEKTTRPCCVPSSPRGTEESFTIHHTKNTNVSHPNVESILDDFLSRTIAGPTRVLASGPSGMICDLRKAVALSNRPCQVWNGDERYDVKLVYDDRLEW